MMYYRVKKEYDNYPILYRKNGKVIQNGILVAGELITSAKKSYMLNKEIMFDKVNVNPKDTYYFFGARFTDKEV